LFGKIISTAYHSAVNDLSTSHRIRINDLTLLSLYLVLLGLLIEVLLVLHTNDVRVGRDSTVDGVGLETLLAVRAMETVWVIHFLG